MRNRSTYRGSTRGRKKAHEEEAEELREEIRQGKAENEAMKKLILGKLKTNLPANERNELLKQFNKLKDGTNT